MSLIYFISSKCFFPQFRFPLSSIALCRFDLARGRKKLFAVTYTFLRNCIQLSAVSIYIDIYRRSRKWTIKSLMRRFDRGLPSIEDTSSRRTRAGQFSQYVKDPGASGPRWKNSPGNVYRAHLNSYHSLSELRWASHFTVLYARAVIERGTVNTKRKKERARMREIEMRGRTRDEGKRATRLAPWRHKIDQAWR